MRIIVTGATGLVGAEVLRQAILNPEVTSITALTRKAPTVVHDKIKVVLHQDFENYSGLESLLNEHDAVVWALGISQSQVSKPQYVKITYDFTLAMAYFIKIHKPEMKFLFVSGEGADTTEKSRAIFAKIKGKTENALRHIELEHLYIVRPGGIKPIHPNPNTAFFNKLMIPLFPVFELFFPNMVISSVQLAKAILKLLQSSSNEVLYQNKALKLLGTS